MLKNCRITNLGSMHTLGIDFGSKLTLITGDADMHQRLLLEGAWRCATTQWIKRGDGRRQPTPADPSGGASAEATVTGAGGGRQTIKAVWNPDRQEWVPYRQYADLTAVYADANGGFHIWIGWNREYGTSYERVLRDEAWNAPPDGPSPRLWPGAVQLAEAQQGDGRPTPTSRMLETLIPRRYLDRYGSPDDAAREIARRRPSGGVERMAALAFVAAWAYGRTSDERAAAGMLLIVEEPELHLHPSWQREAVTRLAALASCMDGNPVQLVAMTNSPLVTASAEPEFDPETTRHWNVSVDRETGAPVVHDLPGLRHGTADQWLMSDAFGLATARNAVAEAAIRDAKRLQLEDAPDAADAAETDRKLHKCLGGNDPFWPRWTYWFETFRKTGSPNG